MEKQKKVYREPFEHSHPGRMLKYGFIESYDLKVEDVADMLGITRVHLSRVLNGRVPITSNLAFKLEALTGMTAQKWLTLQEKYDNYILMKNEDYIRYKEALTGWREKYLEASPKERLGSYDVVAELAKKAFAKDNSPSL